ncbi:MAG TPA: hypothetical protein VFL93_07125 [Longimicrobiaceae bacterium]|nr:hypothetical protein [Longimicrobiaceae bacterium]
MTATALQFERTSDGETLETSYDYTSPIAPPVSDPEPLPAPTYPAPTEPVSTSPTTSSPTTSGATTTTTTTGGTTPTGGTTGGAVGGAVLPVGGGSGGGDVTMPGAGWFPAPSSVQTDVIPDFSTFLSWWKGLRGYGLALLIGVGLVLILMRAS